jgi:hypothetical protein
MQYQYATALSEEPEMDEAIESMLKNNIIEAKTSPYINPVLPIKKGDRIRPVLDARHLSTLIIPEYEHPIPADELLQCFGGVKYISSTTVLSHSFKYH